MGKVSLTFAEAINAIKSNKPSCGYELLGEALDMAVFALQGMDSDSMSGNEYQKLAMRTNDGLCTERLWKASETPGIDVGGIVNASFGLSGETGELNDMIKKAIFHGHELNMDKVKKEIGDILWYVAMMCESFHFEMEDIMKMNIDKLKARYPEGFDPEKSQNRKEGDV